MGGGSETITSAQVIGLSKKFGALKKKIMLENGKYISSGMDVVKKLRMQGINEQVVKRRIAEAFFHAHYFLEMLVKYGNELKFPPNMLPSGWAAVLYLYNLR